nr:MAG TPA: hypothetical protein [Caudoviricetes sp.]
MSFLLMVIFIICSERLLYHVHTSTYKNNREILLREKLILAFCIRISMK